MVNIGINGFGRIGSLTMRVTLNKKDANVVIINDPSMTVEQIVYKLKYDSIHGKLSHEITHDDSHVIINGNKIKVCKERDASLVPWGEFNVDCVFECTGLFTTVEKCQPHLKGGAKKVIISAPSANAPTFVMGVNHKTYKKDTKIISNASCTTNCLAPLAKIINDKFGIEKGLMTTIHAVTSTQKTVDTAASKWRSGRASYQNIIPASTGAAIAVGKVIPEVNGKLTGMAFRVPVPDVSVVDLTVCLKNGASLKDILAELKKASQSDEYKKFVLYVDEDVVSTDFTTNPYSSIIDSKACLRLDDKFVKLISWYDNEWGYSNRVVDLAIFTNCVDNGCDINKCN